jgi:hypothetical protein
VSAACDRPIAPEALVDYWLEDAEGPEVDSLEEHLLGCDACGGRLRGLVALGDGIRRLAHEGAVEMVVTPSFLARAAAEGLRTREYRVPPGGRVDCTVTAQDDLLIGRLMADFKGLKRLDLVAEQEGQPVRRVEDVPFSPDATELIVAQAMPYVRALPQARVRMRLLSPEPGGDRLVGEYTFDHSPGPR